MAGGWWFEGGGYNTGALGDPLTVIPSAAEHQHPQTGTALVASAEGGREGVREGGSQLCLRQRDRQHCPITIDSRVERIYIQEAPT